MVKSVFPDPNNEPINFAPPKYSFLPQLPQVMSLQDLNKMFLFFICCEIW